MRQNSPILFWLSVAAAGVSMMGLVSTGVGIWAYFLDERQRNITWLASDKEATAALQAKLQSLEQLLHAIQRDVSFHRGEHHGLAPE